MSDSNRTSDRRFYLDCFKTIMENKVVVTFLLGLIGSLLGNGYQVVQGVEKTEQIDALSENTRQLIYNKMPIPPVKHKEPTPKSDILAQCKKIVDKEIKALREEFHQ